MRVLSLLLVLLCLPGSALAAGLTTCIKTGEICLQPAETRIIDGLAVYRDCWLYQDSYDCLGSDTTNTCQPLQEAGCSQLDSRCVATDPSGACASFEQTYRCMTAPGTTTQVTSCGNTMTCIDGSCFSAAAAPNQDFALAATHLNVLQAAGQDLDATDFQIFKGKPLGCSKKFLSFSDCCGDSGWGLNLNLDQCNEEELQLIEAARNGRCHLVGSYCSNDTIFGCTRTRLSWCCFNSKLARIVNEQGRPQLAKGWGSSEAPDCSGFTPEQLQSLDFAAMDLSEFYNDVMAKAKGMDTLQAQQNVMERIQNYYDTGTHSITTDQAAPYDSSLAPPAGN